MSSAALPLAALFPMVPLTVWAVLMGLAGFTMVWLGRYTVFERITAVLVGIMFVTVVGLAVGDGRADRGDDHSRVLDVDSGGRVLVGALPGQDVGGHAVE